MPSASPSVVHRSFDIRWLLFSRSTRLENRGSPLQGDACGSLSAFGQLGRCWLVPGSGFLLRSDLLIVATVAGVASRSLRAATRWPSANLDPPPPTARELRIGAEQERLNNPVSAGVGLRPRLASTDRPRLGGGPVASSLMRCGEAVMRWLAERSLPDPRSPLRPSLVRPSLRAAARNQPPGSAGQQGWRISRCGGPCGGGRVRPRGRARWRRHPPVRPGTRGSCR